MFIRRKPNKSGSSSVQVLDKRNRRNILLRSFGSSKNEDELRVKEQEAAEYIRRYGDKECCLLTVMQQYNRKRM